MLKIDVREIEGAVMKTAIRSKNKDWFARNQYNVSELVRRHVCLRTVLSVSYQPGTTCIKIQLSALV
jgi:hypothetical protein